MKAPATPAIDIGIPTKSRKQIADGLAKLLADTYSLYLKTHAFHWNVEGPMFNTLHAMFMVQYTELWNAIDAIAERIRSLGEFAPNSAGELAKAASLKENAAQSHSDEEMLKALLADNEAILKTVRKAHEAADKGGDEATVDLMVERMAYHEKTAWMLRSHLV